MPGLLLLGQGDGSFRQIFKDNVLNISLFHQRQSRFDPVAAVACSRANPYRSHSLSSPFTRDVIGWEARPVFLFIAKNASSGVVLFPSSCVGESKRLLH